MNNMDFTNQLINEKSPYLLQHAHNPVYWFAWGDEAFERAQKENKPVFLSIGYSTCHWCHVMEHESFEDTSVAKILNDHFIAIKVDREERPDIDNVYMDVCQALTGSGGWPLSIIMTPKRMPFYAGTYFPKADFKRLLQMIHARWESDQDRLMASADYIAKEMKNVTADSAEDWPDDDITTVAFEELKQRFDPRFGGFNDRPKFPTPHHLLFLLRYHHAHDEPVALEMVERTLMQMYKGGIFDHIGYGFSRYATDHRWLVPHFEKMLYDNALLAIAYAECFLVTGNSIYKEVADKIMLFISREMTSPEGAFYTGLDADSEGVEGKYYLWTTAELQKLLPFDDFAFICDYYNITDKGNFEGKNILNLIHLDDVRMEKYDQARVGRIRDMLYSYRQKRIPPHLDDKILTSWNAMMIASFASVGRMLGEGEYVAQAEKAMDFIMTHLKGENNRLFARYRDGETKYRGYLDDYAYVVWALLELFSATSKEDYLNQAIAYNHQMLDLFKDEASDGYFQVGKDSEQLFMNPKSIYDGAVPSGNSVATMNLIRLFEITGNPDLEQEAKSQFRAFSESINGSPTASTFMLGAYLLYQASKTKIILVTDRDIKSFSEKLKQTYHPFQTFIILGKNTPSEQFPEYMHQDNGFALYICQNNRCTAPIYDEHEAFQALERL